MEIQNMPFCCTSAIIGMFGEHGEKSLVTIDEINRLCAEKARPRVNAWGEIIENPKFCIMAISVNLKNIALLKEAGFKEIGKYNGVQGVVHILARGLLPE